jgi:hypothetical protein
MQYRIITYTVEVLLREQMPELAVKLFDTMDLNLEVYSVKWFFSLWSIDLPFEYVLTILDLFQIDQQVVLVRVSLAIFSLLSSNLFAAKTQDELHDTLRDFTQASAFNCTSQY